MNRRRFLGSTASFGAALVARPYLARAAAREIIVAEPVHIIFFTFNRDNPQDFNAAEGDTKTETA